MGAQVTIFRLGDDPGLARFIDQVARRIEAGSSCPTSTASARPWSPITFAPGGGDADLPPLRAKAAPTGAGGHR